MKNTPVNHEILLKSGGYLDFENLRTDDIRIDDIATGLGNCCRFAGQCSDFYSVAQHSYYVSTIVPEEDALYALLHDAAEAYIGDMTTPLKAMLPDYRRVEAAVSACVMAAFNLGPMPQSVKAADLILLATEKRDLLPPNDRPWPILEGIEPMPDRIRPWPAASARHVFLQRYRELMTLRGR